MNSMKPLLSLLLFCVSLFASGLAAAVDNDCAQKGGLVHCVPVVEKSDWRYDLCDDWGPYLARRITWCAVMGGTWGDPGPGCHGGGSVSASNGQSLATQFEQQYHNACYLTNTDTGWGASYTSTNCWSAPNGALSVNGVEYMSLRIFDFNGKTPDGNGNCTGTWGPEKVVFKKQRDVSCPAGFGTRSAVDGSTECTGAPPCPTCLGNPIDAGNGAKRLREVDFASTAPFGVSVIRYYNSKGFFDSISRPLKGTDFWRTNWSAQVYGYVDEEGFLDNAYLMAGAVRPDGTVRYFKRDGNELQNVDGRSWTMEVLTNMGIVSGWKITTDEKDVETYAADGRLLDVTTRLGLVYTLAYDGEALASVTDPFGRVTALTKGGFDDGLGGQFTYTWDSEDRLTRVTFPDTRYRTYKYEDANHRFALTGIEDERGVRLATYAYDANGRAISTEHAGGENKFTLTYTDFPTNASATAIDAFGTTRVYGFNKIRGAHKLVSTAIGNIGTESRTYDVNGNLASITDRRGNVTKFTIDGRGLETSRTEAFGTPQARTITTTWHALLPLPASINESPAGLLTEFTYDTSGNLLKRKQASGTKSREWNYTYNARGQVLTVDGPRTDATDTTTIAYFSETDICTGCRAQVSTITNALGHVTTFNAYDFNGRLTQVTDANGIVTNLVYKPRGWLESISVGGETTMFEYDFAGNLTKVTQPDSSWISYMYDEANGLIGIDDSLGNAIDYELDVMGNRVAERVYDPNDGLKRSLQRVYDNVNRLQRELGAAGQQWQHNYDNNGNRLSVSDPLYRTASSTFDPLNRVTRVSDGVGNTDFTYDAKDRLLTVKDARLLTTTYNYDGLGNLTSQVSPDTGTTSFTHDAAGNVATQTDARAMVTTYSYDALDRVTAATVTDGTVTYEYDNLTTGGAYAKGRLTKITDPSGNTTFVYDGRGRITSKTQTIAASPANRVLAVGYAYTSGRQSSVTYPSGRTVTYGFDSQGQVTSVSMAGTAVLGSVEYAPFGPVRKWTWANSQVMERGFDEDGLLKSYTLGPATASYSDLEQVFGYDAVNRLVSAALAAGQTQSFTYDAVGNRTNATINAASTTYTYPATSHKLSSLSGATTRSFTYDNTGNVTASAAINYTYDGRGRMKQAGSTTYLVNGLGQRVKKAGAGEVYFAYDEAGHLIGEYDATGAAIQETIWLGDIPVAVVKPNGGGFTVYNVWSDHLNTPRLITDAANNSRWEWGHNDPFGNNAANENPGGLGQFAYNLRFPGQYYDAETGTAYNMARDYDARIGRYIQSDPIGLAGGINTFGYVEGNPLKLIDPLGLVALPFPIPVPGAGSSSGSASAAIARGLGRLWDNVKEFCQPSDEPNKKNCEKASKWQLQAAGINDEHDFKADETGSGRRVSQYDICACSDGTIVLRGVGQCGRSGPTVETSRRWKRQ